MSSYAPVVTSILAAGAVLAAALVKGAIGFGFPTLGTPLLSLAMDVKTAVVVLIVPNIAMDGIQFVRRGSPLAIVRRFAPLLVGGAVGTVVGTRLLMALSSRVALLVLGLFIVLFVALTAAGVTLRVSPRGERWASPLVGLLTGIIGGITNVPGTPLVVYFQALGLPKHDFVAAMAFTFVAYKLVQLGAVTSFGLLTWPLIGISLGLTLAALAGFTVGLLIQDRLEQPAARSFSTLAAGMRSGRVRISLVCCPRSGGRRAVGTTRAGLHEHQAAAALEGAVESYENKAVRMLTECGCVRVPDSRDRRMFLKPGAQNGQRIRLGGPNGTRYLLYSGISRGYTGRLAQLGLGRT